VATVVTYPQYWSGRLSGQWRCECTSLGSHTDLWNPWTSGFSALPARLGLADRFAPLAPASARLGPVTHDVVRATGLPAATPVFCGLHDSNAALLPHLLSIEPPFAVVSTGTWVISMAVGGREVALDPRRDTLVNVDAFGRPTPSARFMGGREFDLMRAETAEAGPDDIAAVLERGAFLLPSIDQGSGPFAGRRGGWSDPAMTPGEKSAALSFYLALMTATCLDLIGADGAVVVEGPFGRNALFLDMLAAVTERAVRRTGDGGRASMGAALLADPAIPPVPPVVDRAGLDPVSARNYAAAWHRAVSAV
jgi:sugar (pentulose or hexulose) kinase